MLQIILVAINATGVLLAWWVIQSGSRAELKRWFFFMNVFVLLWVNLAYFGLNAQTEEMARLLYHLNYGAVSLFFVSFYYFYVIHFLHKSGKANHIGKIIGLASVIFFVVSIATDWIVEDVTRQSWGMGIVFGQLSIFFNIFASLVALVIVFYSVQGYRNLSREMQVKTQYFLAGIFIFIAANLIFNVAPQLLFHSVQYQLLGDFSVVFLLGFTAYSTIQHRLFDVRVVAAEASTAFLVVVLFSRIMVAQTITDKTIDTIIFLFALFFGYLLVRSVRREVEQKDELARLNKKLEDLDAKKNEFLNVASHELRAPLTAIKGYLSMVRAGDGGELPEKARDMINETSSETDRMIRLVNNMLDVARIEEGRMLFRQELVNLAEIVKTAFHESEFDAANKSLKYELKVTPEVKDSVSVDPDRMHEVLTNLINNAVKYTDEGNIKVLVSNPSHTKVRVDVVDTGPGISEKDQKHLFQKFYRADTYIGKKIGTGLGLYISRLIVEKFDGSIGFKSKEGKGTTFWFELPLAQ